MDIKKRLSEKGWKKRDISKAIKIIEKARANKHPKIKLLDKFVIWFSFAIAIIGNFIISITMIPFILAFDNLNLYFIVLIAGLSFGLLFELLIRSMWHFENKHHILFSTIISLIAIINFALIVTFSSNINKTLKVGYSPAAQNPILVGIAYAFAFILPYLIYQFFLKNK